MVTEVNPLASRQALAIDNFINEINEIYKEAGIFNDGSKVQIGIEFEVKTKDIETHPYFHRKFEPLKVVNNGKEFVKDF